MKDSLDILCTNYEVKETTNVIETVYHDSLNILRTDVICHHGILGMKWGIRRFQPYPKGYSGDGKYTGDQQKKEYKIAKKSQHMGYKSSYERQLDYAKKSKLVEQAAKDLEPLADKMVNAELDVDVYREHLPKEVRNKIFATAVEEATKEAKRIDPEFGHQGARYDNKVVEMLLAEGNFEDTAERNYLKNDKKFKELKDNKLKTRKEYKEALKKEVDEIVGGYGDTKIGGLSDDKMTYRELVSYAIADKHSTWSFTADEKMGRNRN